MACQTKKFQPLEYDIELSFLDEFTHVEGRVDILARFGEPLNLMNTVITNLFQRSDNYFVLNVLLDCELLDLSLLASNSIEQLRNGIENRLPVKTIWPDEKRDTIEVHLQADLPLGSYVIISITYKGPTNWSLHSGAIYDATNQRKTLYHSINLTQLTYPDYVACFDPSLKAKIRLTINQPQVDSCVISNMPHVEESIVSRSDGSLMKQTKFQQTSVAMPVSWIGFAIGPYHKIPSSHDGININLFEPEGHSGEGEFALELATKAVEWITSYLELGHPLKTINLVAVPPLQQDSNYLDMQNSLGIGLMNCDYLLIDELTSSPEHKIEVALYVVLMVVQQWFGNIIEPESTKHRWIIEGLALHIAMRIVDELRPDYRVDQYVRSDKIKHLSEFKFSYYHFKEPELRPEYLYSTSLSFSALQMYLVENQNQFDRIIRFLVSNGLTKGISRSMLIKAFANPSCSKRKIDKMIELLYSRKCIIFVDLKNNSLFLTTSQYGDHVVWPLSMKVYFSSADNSNNSISEVPVRKFNKDKGLITMKVPGWFDCNEKSTGDWLKVVIGENELQTHYEIHYSSKLISRLRKPIESGLLSPMERICIIRHAIRCKNEDYVTLTDLVDCFRKEQDPNVLLELVWAIDKSPYKYPYQDQLKRIYTQVGGLQVTGQESPSEQCVKSIVALMLVKLHDEQVIEEALALFDSMGDKLVGFQREPVYMTVATKRLDREMFSSRLAKASLPGERARIWRMISHIIDELTHYDDLI